jgi:hypothetical protein
LGRNSGWNSGRNSGWKSGRNSGRKSRWLCLKYGLLARNELTLLPISGPVSGRNSGQNFDRNSGRNSGRKSRWLCLKYGLLARNGLTLLPISGPVSGQIAYCNIVIRIDLPSRPTRWKKKLKILGVTPKTRGNNLKIKLDIKTQGMILIQPLFTWSKWNLYLKLPFYFEIPPCKKLFSLVVFHGLQNPIFSKRSPYQLIIFVFSKNYKFEKWISFAIGHFWKTKKKNVLIYTYHVLRLIYSLLF